MDSIILSTHLSSRGPQDPCALLSLHLALILPHRPLHSPSNSPTLPHLTQLLSSGHQTGHLIQALSLSSLRGWPRPPSWALESAIPFPGCLWPLAQCPSVSGQFQPASSSPSLVPWPPAPLAQRPLSSSLFAFRDTAFKIIGFVHIVSIFLTPFAVLGARHPGEAPNAFPGDLGQGCQRPGWLARSRILS